MYKLRFISVLWDLFKFFFFLNLTCDCRAVFHPKKNLFVWNFRWLRVKSRGTFDLNWVGAKKHSLAAPGGSTHSDWSSLPNPPRLYSTGN